MHSNQGEKSLKGNAKMLKHLFPKGGLWSFFLNFDSYTFSKYLYQGSPTPGLWTSTGLRPVRNQATQQEVSSRQASDASSAAPHRSPSLTLPPEPSPTPPTPHPWKNCLP